MHTETQVLRFTVTTALAEAREAIERSGEAMALVTNLGADVGVVTVGDLARGARAGATTIGEVMRRELVSIDPATDLRHTLRAYSDAAWVSAIRRRPGGVDA